MSIADKVLTMIWAFPRGDSRQDDVRELADEIRELETNFAEAMANIKQMETTWNDLRRNYTELELERDNWRQDRVDIGLKLDLRELEWNRQQKQHMNVERNLAKAMMLLDKYKQLFIDNNQLSILITDHRNFIVDTEMMKL